MARRERLRVLALAVAGLVHVSLARAEGGERPRVRLRYDRAAEASACPTEPDLRAAVAARLGYDPFVTDATVDTLDVHVRKKGRGLEGSIERTTTSVTAPGRPTLIFSPARDCAELAASLAVALAIAVDPLGLGREEPPAPEPPPPPPPAAPLPPPALAPKKAPPVPAPKTPTRLVVAVGPALSIGALPGPSFGVRAAAGVAHGWFEAAVEGRFDPPVEAKGASGSVDASLVLGTLLPCFHYRFVVACAQVSFGALRGSGNDLDRTREANTFYAAAGARTGVEIPLGSHFAVRILAEGQVPLRPTRLEANDAPVWSTPPFAAALVPMLVGRFP
jgi:hypothetical protein